VNAHLSFAGLLRSEWIKLWTVRSTWWCFGIIFALTVSLAAIVALVSSPPQIDPISAQDPLLLQQQTQTAVLAVTIGLTFSQLVVSVIGALVITGEYGTGMIRSTFMAAPGRTSALLAKAVVFAVATLLLGLATTAVSAFFAFPLLTASGFEIDMSDPGLWSALIGAVLFLPLIGLLATAIGALLRNSAGAIATALAVILVLPTVVVLIAGVTRSQALNDLGAFLPSSAGGRMYAYDIDYGGTSSGVMLEPWQGGLVLLCWVVVVGAVAIVVTRRQDV
jgi:ABC-2 type transport system permease protein